jgi:hypothetical protein
MLPCRPNLSFPRKKNILDLRPGETPAGPQHQSRRNLYISLDKILLCSFFCRRFPCFSPYARTSSITALPSLPSLPLGLLFLGLRLLLLFLFLLGGKPSGYALGKMLRRKKARGPKTSFACPKKKGKLFGSTQSVGRSFGRPGTPRHCHRPGIEPGTRQAERASKPR